MEAFELGKNRSDRWRFKRSYSVEAKDTSPPSLFFHQQDFRSTSQVCVRGDPAVNDTEPLRALGRGSEPPSRDSLRRQVISFSRHELVQQLCRQHSRLTRRTAHTERG